MTIQNAIGRLWYNDLVEAKNFWELLNKMTGDKKYKTSFNTPLDALSRFDNKDDSCSAVNYLIATHQQEEALRVIEFCKPFREQLEHEI